MAYKDLSLVGTLAFMLVAAPMLSDVSPVEAQLFDHLQCHRIKDPGKFEAVVDLVPFDTLAYPAAAGCQVKVKGKELCTPTSKTVQSTNAPVLEVDGQDLANDFICYKMKCPKQDHPDRVMADQFGERVLTRVKRAQRLCVPAEPLACEVTFSVADTATLGALQFQVDYSAALGAFVGDGVDVVCTPLAAGAFSAVNDDDAQSLLQASFAAIGGTAVPGNILRCDYRSLLAPAITDFVVTTVDSHVLTSPGLGSNVCAAPTTGSDPPFARDAYQILRASVGEDFGCDLCECDVDGVGGIGATDALLALRASTGESVSLDCPACVGGPVVTPPSASVSVEVSSVTCE